MKNYFKSKIDIGFDGMIGHCLGVNFQCSCKKEGKASIHMSQPAFIENLLHKESLHGPDVNLCITPYKSGTPVDKLPA